MTQQIIALTDAKVLPINITNKVLRGQAAWRKLKETAAEQRELWRQVGEALLVGKRMYKSNNKFNDWIKENGFGDMHRNTRADAMWLAENWESVAKSLCNNAYTHPSDIRRTYNEWLKSQEDAKASPDLPKAEDIKPTKVLTRKQARKVNQLKAHADGTGPEAEIAKRRLHKAAEAEGMTVDELTDKAVKSDPTYGMPPGKAKAVENLIEHVKGGLRNVIDAFNDTDIPLETLRALVEEVIQEKNNV